MAINWLSPWEPILESEPMALVFLEELKKEISPQHILFNKQVEAIARRRDNDDVLFKLFGNPTQYAVVHLTWSNQQEADESFPFTTIFPDFETWVIDCMEKDHNDQIDDV